MTLIDWLILAGFVAALVVGIIRGFLKQIFGFIGVLVIPIGATYLAPLPNRWLEGAITDSGTRYIVSLLATLVVLILVYWLITSLISKLISKLPILGWLNRILGAVLAVGITYVIISLLVSIVLGNESSTFLSFLKNLLYEPFSQSKIITVVYGGAENPERNFFGTWLIKMLLEKLGAVLPAA